MSLADHYHTLGVASDASIADLRRAYLDLMRHVHPDLNTSEGSAERARAINEAYRILSHPVGRARYDIERSQEKRSMTASRCLQAAASHPGRYTRIGRSSGRHANTSQSWILLLSVLGAGILAGAILDESGRFDPSAGSVFEYKPVVGEGSREKQSDDLIKRIAIDDLRQSNFDSPRLSVRSLPTPFTQRVVKINIEAPLSADLAAGAREFARISLENGFGGARDLSETCHRNVARSQSLREADRCTAFDFTASYADAEVSVATLQPANAYFKAQGSQAAQVYRSVGLSAQAARVRLSAVKRAILPMIASAG
jgi:curved DNA-binding protein CbpA